jgi:cytoskeletal protein CcmA (bactofilin family)
MVSTTVNRQREEKLLAPPSSLTALAHMLSSRSFASKPSGRKAKPDPAGAGSRTSLSVIAQGLRVEGQLTSSGALRIEGALVGTVRCESQVLVAKGGTVRGDIYAPEIITDGEVNGSILATNRAELLASSVVKGNITTNHLVVHEGSKINGRLKTGKQQSTLQPADERCATDRPAALDYRRVVASSGDFLGDQPNRRVS